MSGRVNNNCSRLACGVLSLATACALIGCTRAYYRKQADCDVSQLVEEKSYDPRWDQSGFTIAMDPRSRYYDVYDPDHPPMPPDDPDSHELMHCVDDKEGFSQWHDNGDIQDLENPNWRECLANYVEQTDDGNYRLRLEDAIRLARIHLPSYQQQLETLYLSALDVSSERFRFDVQFFGGIDTTFEHRGADKAGGESNELRIDDSLEAGGSGRRVGGGKLFATGAEALVGFANSFIWEFSGGDVSSAFSLLNFSVFQPLLRAGGRAVVLEQLTLAERTLLANLRAFEQYRQGFYTRLVIGDSGGISGPRRRGGFLGGTGLTGFTGQGSGGFGGVGAATGFGRGGFDAGGGNAGGGGGGTLGAGGGAGNVGGYIGLLQALQQLRNRKDNLNLQLRTLALLEANQKAGLIGLDQVLQFQQSIETERANLLQAQNSFDNSLEAFKSGNLGLPPDLPIEMDDSLIRPFQFLDPQMSAIENRIAHFIDAFGELEAKPAIVEIEQAFTRVTELKENMADQFDVVRRDLKYLDSKSAARQERMNSDERKQFLSDIGQLSTNWKQLEDRFEKTEGLFNEWNAGLREETRGQSADQLVVLSTDLLNFVGELSLIQVRARLESVTLEPVELESADALEIARANRLDWMNNRAALVDSWRLIEFNANALLSDLNVRFDGDIRTTTGKDNPVDFRGPTGTLSAKLEFDAPLTRLLERNNFRQQLINYQQARRQLIQFEDGVNRGLRQTLRGLKQLEVNLEIQRRAVAIAIRRVDQARENLNRPVAPALPGQAPTAQFGPTATRDLVDALEALRDAQNNFMSVWLNYYAGRMGLMRDLGVMHLDENGLWIDAPLDEVMRQDNGEAFPLPPPVPVDWMTSTINEQPTPIDDLPMEADGRASENVQELVSPTSKTPADESGWLPTRKAAPD